MNRFFILTFGVMICLIGYCKIMAGEPTIKPAEKNDAKKESFPSKATPEQIAQWIKDLDNDDFKVRQFAAQKLSIVGKNAFPALVEAIDKGSLETITQIISILKNFYEGKDKPARDAARETLQKIAEGSNATASARAKEILKPEMERAERAKRGRIMAPGWGDLGIEIGPGGELRKRFLDLPEGAEVQGIHRQVTNINGEKHLKVNENGKETEIQEGANGITVKITENGNTSEYKAKDAEELKAKFPDAYKIYKEQTDDTARAKEARRRLEQAARGFGGPRGFGLNSIELDNPQAALKNIQDTLDESEKQLAELAKKKGVDGNVLKSAMEKMKAARDELNKAAKKIEDDKKIAVEK